MEDIKTNDKINRIAGYNEEKKELLNIRKILHNISDYKSKGVRIPKGVLLYGEPGVGKTVMAHAIADDGINFIELRAADFCGEGVGMAVKNAFELAKKQTGSTLLFLDELDKIASDEEDLFVKACKNNDDVKKILLQELDNLKEEDNVLVVATCNDISMLSEALIRPGRFDKKMKIPAPDFNNRRSIIIKYSNRLKLKKNFDYDYLARITSGYTGAMLECVINESGILALEQNKPEITLEIIQLAMDKLSFHGCAKEIVGDLESQTKIALHESGHILVALELKPDLICGASILKQGSTEGHIRLVEEEKLPTVMHMEQEIMILLAGRIAEREVLGDISLGAEKDLRQAVKKTFNLFTRHAPYGEYAFLIEQLGDFKGTLLSAERKYQLEQKIENLLLNLDKKVTEIIRGKRDFLNNLVLELLNNQVLTRDEIFRLRKKYDF